MPEWLRNGLQISNGDFSSDLRTIWGVALPSEVKPRRDTWGQFALPSGTQVDLWLLFKQTGCVKRHFRQVAQILQKAFASNEPSWGDDAPESDLDKLRSAFLNEYRRRLERGALGGKNLGWALAGRARYARRKTQELAKLLRSGKYVPLPRHLLLAQRRPSTLLDALFPNRLKSWIPVMRRRNQVVADELVLHQFSIIERPAATIKLLQKIAAIECTALRAQLHFDDQHCIDISPYLFLAEVWPFMANVFHGGRMSEPIQKVIEAVGLRRALGFRLSHVNDLRDVWAFPIRRRRASQSSRSLDRYLVPQTREKVSDEFCDALDVWLAMAAKLELTEEGKARFSSIIGELLDNAERHSEPNTKDGSWSVAAFMARRPENGRDIFQCYMAFLSEGWSIADSLDTAADSVRRDIDNYCARHAGAGQSRQTLATLIALQDGITRDAAATAEQRGGIGFQDVMEFVNAMGGTNVAGREPRITIVSGISCVQLRPPFILGRRSGAGQPRVLWCNTGNTAKDPPDPSFVFDLEDRFAGTIVGLSFILDPEYLRAAFDAPDRPRRPDE